MDGKIILATSAILGKHIWCRLKSGIYVIDKRLFDIGGRTCTPYDVSNVFYYHF